MKPMLAANNDDDSASWKMLWHRSSKPVKNYPFGVALGQRTAG
jgi:hypothetical protein